MTNLILPTNQLTLGNGFPRRSAICLNTDAEKAIFNAIQEIEKIGASEELTEISIMLSNAKTLLGNYVDKKFNVLSFVVDGDTKGDCKICNCERTKDFDKCFICDKKCKTKE